MIKLCHKKISTHAAPLIFTLLVLISGNLAPLHAGSENAEKVTVAITSPADDSVVGLQDLPVTIQSTFGLSAFVDLYVNDELLFSKEHIGAGEAITLTVPKAKLILGKKNTLEAVGYYMAPDDENRYGEYKAKKVKVTVIQISFNPSPVDNIILGATPVPVTVTVNPEAAAKDITFQANNENVTVQGTAPNITVTGVKVGESVVKAMASGNEIGNFNASVIENPDFLPANGTVAAGAPPSQPLNGAWGLTWPENVAATITAGRDGGNWRAIITSATGNYSIQATLIAGCTEVTGPGGNTTRSNWVAQVANLSSLNGPTWYMVAAVQAHEQVHADKFDNGFQTAAVVDIVERDIEGLTVNAASQADAITALRGLPGFAATLTAAQNNWLAQILTLVPGDHAAGGPCDTAEHGVVDPMINRIQTHAAAQGW